MFSFTFYSLIDNFVYNIFYLTFLSTNVYVYLITFFFIIWQISTVKVFRKKFIYFILLLIYIGILGFYFSLDGFIFILLLTELLIIFLFLLVFMTHQYNTSDSKKFNTLFKWYFILGTCIMMFILPIIYIGNTFNYFFLYTQISYIITNDFFSFFYFFFSQYNLLVFFIAILLTLFSIFFIFIYFLFKSINNQTKLKHKSLLLLRKQHMMHQSIFKTQIYTFQK